MTDIYFHESGHTVMAKIFDRFYETFFVTLDQKEAMKYHPSNLGGLAGNPKKSYGSFSFEDHDAFIFIFLAGFCTDALVNYQGQLPNDFFNMTNWGPKFGSHIYSGDIQLVNRDFYEINSLHNSISWESYISATLKCVCRILQEPIIWDSILSVRRALMDSDSQTLHANELNLIFEALDVDRHINKKLPLIIAYRQNLLIL